jgi:D-lactate dehydrogenase
VIGTGDIGEHALRIGKGFGMELLAFDVVRRDELADEIGFAYVDFDELLRRSDVITIHVPLTEATQGLLDREAFGKMKEGAILINTSRGPIVDAEALTDALAKGQVAAAGLDVLAEERAVRDDTIPLDEDARAGHDTDTLLANHVLLRQDNVLVTPHIGFNTREAVRRIVETTIGNILAFERGEAENTVTGVTHEHARRDQRLTAGISVSATSSASSTSFPTAMPR